MNQFSYIFPTFFEKILPVLISFIPTMFIFSFVMYSGRESKVPIFRIFLCILGGIAAVFLAYQIEYHILPMMNIYHVTVKQILENSILMFLVSCIEEILKFGFLFLLIFFHKDFNDPYDGIVYASVIALSFAGIENAIYVVKESTMIDIASLTMVRAFTALPLHTVCGMIMGYYFSEYQFSKKRRLLSFCKALIFPITIHGFYNGIFSNLYLMNNLFGQHTFQLALFGACFYIGIIYLIGIILVKEATMLNKLFLGHKEYPEKFSYLMSQQEFERRQRFHFRRKRKKKLKVE